jgi:hypothetical protein
MHLMPRRDACENCRAVPKLAKGVGILKVAKPLGIGTGTVQRISKERAMSLRGEQ